MQAFHGEGMQPSHLDRDSEFLLELPDEVALVDVHVNDWRVRSLGRRRLAGPTASSRGRSVGRVVAQAAHLALDLLGRLGDRRGVLRRALADTRGARGVVALRDLLLLGAPGGLAAQGLWVGLSVIGSSSGP